MLTINVLSEDQVRSEVSRDVSVAQAATPSKITMPMNLLRITIQSNSMVSALNTNMVLSIIFDEIFVEPTLYNVDSSFSTVNPNMPVIACTSTDATAPSKFLLESQINYGFTKRYDPFIIWPPSDDKSFILSEFVVNGFYTGCYPLAGILASTLDCLYEIQCLELLPDYFPSLNTVCVIKL